MTERSALLLSHAYATSPPQSARKRIAVSREGPFPFHSDCQGSRTSDPSGCKSAPGHAVRIRAGAFRRDDMTKALGFDFGTTNSVLAASQGETTESLSFTSTAGTGDTMRTALSFTKHPQLGA